MKSSPNHRALLKYVGRRHGEILINLLDLNGEEQEISKQKKATADKQSCFFARDSMKSFVELLPDVFG